MGILQRAFLSGKRESKAERFERDFTRTLWQMCTECIVVFPGGVNVRAGYAVCSGQNPLTLLG